MFSIVADESVDAPIVAALRDAGHEILAVAETQPSISDTEVMALAYGRRSILLTMDRDFGELVFRLGSTPPPGIVYVRSKGMPLHETIENVSRCFAGESPIGQFTTVGRGGTRLRSLPVPDLEQ